MLARPVSRSLYSTCTLHSVSPITARDMVTIRDVANTNVEGVYVGGVFVWLHDGTDLRTLYVVDTTYG